jgi:hypothetical protein
MIWRHIYFGVNGFICYDVWMIVIRFTDQAIERRALGWLAGRFSYKTWKDGGTLVPEAALAALARAGIPFLSQGPATYEQIVAPVRNPIAAAAQ